MSLSQIRDAQYNFKLVLSPSLFPPLSLSLCVCVFLVVRSCKGQFIDIDCLKHGVVKVFHANYSRSPGICGTPGIPDSIPVCHNTTALTSLLLKKCDGRPGMCSLFLERIFDDPCEGTWDFVEVYYTCIIQEEGPWSSYGLLRYIPNKATKESPMSFVVQVMRKGIFTFAMRHSDVLVQNVIRVCTQVSKQAHCTAQDSLSTVRGLCQERTSCIVPATSGIPGDPCVGTYKCMEIQYLCTKLSRVCEHSSMTIRCPWGQKIWIIDGFYGRMSGSELCPHPSIKTKNCRAESGLAYIKEQCHQQQSCTLSASNDVFGDPCIYTYKYLEVMFVGGRMALVHVHFRTAGPWERFLTGGADKQQKRKIKKGIYLQAGVLQACCS